MPGGEAWLPVPNWETEYSISSAHRVRSEARIVLRRNGVKYSVAEHIMRPCRHRHGRLSVNLSRPGYHQRIYLATLARQLFGTATRCATTPLKERTR